MVVVDGSALDALLALAIVMAGAIAIVVVIVIADHFVNP